MASMSGMQMPGGWTMSMMWMRMPDQTWSGAAGSFLGLWIVMMIAMMLPSLLPMLQRYREAVRIDAPARLARSTLLAALGYFLVWSVLGLIAYPLGVALAATAMEMPALSRLVPVSIGVAVAVVGALQFTRSKLQSLACCRGESCCRTRPIDTARALRHGLELGMQCASCCGGMMIVLLLVGMMDMVAMAIVSAAITLERIAPSGELAAKTTGVIAVAAGLVFVVRAL
jgi:predicted metal-binding membrane protein